MEQQAIITVKDLRTYFYSDKRCNKVLNGVSFELYKGRTLCVVGESGCGKSVTASSIMQLLPKLSRIESGAITYLRGLARYLAGRRGRTADDPSLPPTRPYAMDLRYAGFRTGPLLHHRAAHPG